MALLKTWIFHADGFTPLKEFSNILFKCFLLKWAIQEVFCRIRLRKDISRNNYEKGPGLSVYPLAEIHKLSSSQKYKREIIVLSSFGGHILKCLMFLLLDQSQSNCCSILNPPKMQPVITTWWASTMARTGMRTQPKEVITLVPCVLFQPQPPPCCLRAPLWRDGSYSTACPGPEWCCYKEGEHTSLLKIFSLSVCDWPAQSTHPERHRWDTRVLFDFEVLPWLFITSRNEATSPVKALETSKHSIPFTTFGLPGLSVLIDKAIQGIGLCFLRYHVYFHQHDLLWHLTGTIWTVNQQGKLVSVCNEMLTAILHYLLLSFLRDTDLNILKNKCAPPSWHTCFPQKL